MPCPFCLRACETGYCTLPGSAAGVAAPAAGAAAAPAGRSRNVEAVGYGELDHRPAFRTAVRHKRGRWYLDTGHFWNPPGRPAGALSALSAARAGAPAPRRLRRLLHPRRLERPSQHQPPPASPRRPAPRRPAPRRPLQHPPTRLRRLQPPPPPRGRPLHAPSGRPRAAVRPGESGVRPETAARSDEGDQSVAKRRLGGSPPSPHGLAGPGRTRRSSPPSCPGGRCGPPGETTDRCRRQETGGLSAARGWTSGGVRIPGRLRTTGAVTQRGA